MNRDSNSYIFGFAAAMVLVVASVLAFTASSLKDLQSENVRKEKMQNILSTIGIETNREGAENLFNDYVTEDNWAALTRQENCNCWHLDLRFAQYLSLKNMRLNHRRDRP